MKDRAASDGVVPQVNRNTIIVWRLDRGAEGHEAAVIEDNSVAPRSMGVREHGEVVADIESSVGMRSFDFA